MIQPTRPQVARTLAAITILAAFPAAFGFDGLLAAILTATILATLPPSYGFAVGQLALALLAPTTLPGLLTPTIIGAELALLLALWSPLTTIADRSHLPIALATTTLLALITMATVGETGTLWLTGGILLATIVGLAYALHRYALVFVLETTT